MTCGSVPCHVNPEGREAWVVAGFVAQGCGCSPVHVLDGPVPFPEINMVVLFLVLSPAMEICDNHVTPTVETELKVTQSALDVHTGCTPFVKDW